VQKLLRQDPSENDGRGGQAKLRGGIAIPLGVESRKDQREQERDVEQLIKRASAAGGCRPALVRLPSRRALQPPAIIRLRRVVGSERKTAQRQQPGMSGG